MLKKLITESNFSYDDLKHMSIIEILNAIHEEDKKIIPAIKRTLHFKLRKTHTYLHFYKMFK